MSKKRTAEEPLEELLTAEEVVRSLRVSRSKVYLMVASGELRAIRIGRLLRFQRSDVQALIMKRAADGKKPEERKKKGRT